MKKVIIPTIVLFIIIALTFCFWSKGDDSCNDTSQSQATNLPIDRSLQNSIDSFIRKVPHVGSLGIMFYDVTASKEIYSLDADKLMRPASCMKLLTCITALHKVGNAYKYKTRLYATGKVVGDTLMGNLTLKTQFDPAFNRDSLYALTDRLKEKGIRKIKGKVILDMADYTTMQHEEHWTMGDLRTRRLGLSFYGGNRLRTEMIYALSRIGIPLTKNDIVFGRLNLKDARIVAESRTSIHYPLEKAMKNSSNINAEALTYLLGYTVNSKGNFRSNGRIALKKFISEQLHMDPNKCSRIDDGCGLCPNNRLTPRLLTNLMAYASQHKGIYDEVINDLPLSGTDGTLHDRLIKSNVKGKVRAKTGTLTREDGISTLTGYFTGRDGHLIAFSIMNNECPVMDGRWWQDKLLTKIIK